MYLQVMTLAKLLTTQGQHYSHRHSSVPCTPPPKRTDQYQHVLTEVASYSPTIQLLLATMEQTHPNTIHWLLHWHKAMSTTWPLELEVRTILLLALAYGGSQTPRLLLIPISTNTSSPTSSLPAQLRQIFTDCPNKSVIHWTCNHTYRSHCRAGWLTCHSHCSQPNQSSTKMML